MTALLTAKEVFDGARAVTFADDMSPEIAVVWSGGTTFNVYMASYDGPEWTETDVFNVSDAKGRPVDRETAVQHMEDYLDREV